jgi:hypothetical protein
LAKLETTFRKRVDAFLKTLPFCKQFSIQQKALVGHPDKMICLAGWFVALEIKTDVGVASAKQILTLEEVLKAKGTALIVRPSNFEEIKEILRKISRGIRYDSNEIQGLAPSKSSANFGEDRKHTNGSGKKLRAKQNAVSDPKRDPGDSDSEQGSSEKFREI